MLASIQTGRLADATSQCDELLSQDPDCFDALRLRGTICLMQGQHREAVSLLRRALRHEPANVEVLTNLGAALQNSGGVREAIAVLRKAVARQPDRREALLNLGGALREVYELDEATALFEKVLALDGGNAQAYHNLGNVLCEAGRAALAIACYESALRTTPDNPETQFALSQALLVSGDFKRGWQAYEARLRCDAYRNWPGWPRGLARWDGREPIGGRLLLIAEQGYGDAIQFVRYGRLLKQAGVRTVLQCYDRLVALLKSCGFFEDVIPFGAPPPDLTQAWLPLMSLPLLQGTELATISKDIPYLRAEPDLVDRWSGRLGPDRALRIGIAWQGNPAKEVGHLRGRSIPLQEFKPLLSVPNVQLFSLQKGSGVEQMQSVEFASRVKLPESELDSGPDGFLDTAALMMHLDLIVTSDTSIAHLAGALGRPVWVALRYSGEWRWLLGRQDSPWYPTMRLFRQRTPGRWGPVFSSMAQELRHLRHNQSNRESAG